jgi:ParB family chromosome partitioning protein
MSEWRNRIVGHGDESPGALMANPFNFRVHGKLQKSALKGSLESLGVIQTVTVNKSNGRIIDGHLRVATAIEQKQATIPVTYVELSEAEEAQALLSLDPIAAMAQTDSDNMDALLKMVETDNAEVMQYLEDLARENGITEGMDGFDFGGLPSEDRAPFRQVTFTLHDSQFEVIEAALKQSKSLGEFVDSPNENSNGNALARICELFNGQNERS